MRGERDGAILPDMTKLSPPKTNSLLDKAPRVRIENPRGKSAEKAPEKSTQRAAGLNLAPGASLKGTLADGIRHLKSQIERKEAKT